MKSTSILVATAIFSCNWSIDQACATSYPRDDLVTTIRSSPYLLTVKIIEARLIEDGCYRHEYALVKRHWGTEPVVGFFLADAPMTVGQTYAVFNSEEQPPARRDSGDGSGQCAESQWFVHAADGRDALELIWPDLAAPSVHWATVGTTVYEIPTKWNLKIMEEATFVMRDGSPNFIVSGQVLVEWPALLEAVKSIRAVK